MTDGRPGLFESVRVRRGEAPLWALHLERLRRSSVALELPEWPVDAPSGGPDRIVRITLGTAGVARGERPLPPLRPLEVVISRVPHPGYPHKTDERAPFTVAAEEAGLAGADEALLLTASGWAAEGTISALFWWEAEGLAAPALDLGILPSVARRRIAEIAGEVREQRRDGAELRGRSIFLANAARGIMEVASLQGESVPTDARTTVLAERFWP